MGLFTTPPRVTLEGPGDAIIGGRYQATVVVETDEDIPVEYVDVQLRGVAGWTVSQGKTSVSNWLTLPDDLIRVFTADGAPNLPRGQHRFPVSFGVPGTLAPTHRHRPAASSLTLTVRVAIPWKIDPRTRFELVARLPPPAAVRRDPIAVRSAAAGVASKVPRIELSAASATVVAGEVIAVSCALYNVDDREPIKVKVALIRHLSLHGRGDRQREEDVWTNVATFPAGCAGEGMTFEVPTAASWTPTFDSPTHSIRWTLEVTMGSLLGGRKRAALPLDLLDPAARSVAAPMGEAPLLGDERTQLLFDAAMRRAPGWTVDAPDEAPGEAAAAKTIVDGVTARVAHVESRATGGLLVTEIHPPDLGMQLSVTPGSTVRHLFWRDIEIGDDGWDEDHVVRARLPVQAVAFLRVTVPALKGARALGTLMRVDDHGARFERPVAGATTEVIRVAMDEAAALARVFARARQAIPAPDDVSTDLAAWHEVAKTLGGDLGRGNLRVEGTLDGAPAAIALRWRDDGTPRDLRVEVGDAATASAATAALQLELASPANQALDVNVPPALTELLLRWPDDHVDLTVAHGAVAASLRLGTAADGRPHASAEAALALTRRLRGLLAALAPAAGPFR